MRKATHEMTKDPVVLKIMELLRQNKKTEKDLERELGLAQGAFVRWKYLDGKSYNKYLYEIAAYLNVTPEYILSDDKVGFTMEDLTEKEINLINMFRKLHSKEKDCVMNMIEVLINRD